MKLYDVAAVVLLVIGILLFFIEIAVPSVGILALMGIAACAVALSRLFDLGYIVLSDPALWAFSAVCIVVLLIVSRLAYKAQMARVSAGPEDMIGEDATVSEWNGKKGKVAKAGEIWYAKSDEDLDLKTGDEVTITECKNLKLTIKKKD